MSRPNRFDDADRPKAPRIDGLTPAQRARGSRLAVIHRLHLQQLDRVREAMRQIEDGECDVARLGRAIGDLQLASNYRRFGVLCGEECPLLTFHHTSEDSLIFPALQAQGGAGLRPVLDRLAEEHAVIHELIEEMEDRSGRAAAEPGPETFAALKETFVVLYELVRSHFGYEERELGDALGCLDVPL